VQVNTNLVNSVNSDDLKIPAVILAAGQGKRLMPYTEKLPKPLVTVGGKPILEYVLTHLIDAGIRHFFIVVGYQSDKIEQWIEDEFVRGIYCDYEKRCSKKLGPLGFSYIHQDDINGTGGAALLAEAHVLDNGYNSFFLTYGDILVSTTVYRRIIQEYMLDVQNNVKKDLYLVGNLTEDPSMGAALYYKGDRVVKLIEKPDKSVPKTDLNNAGIYIFNKDIFNRLKITPRSVRGEIELTWPIIEILKQENKVIKLIRMNPNEFWCDVGTVKVLEDLNRNTQWKKLI
jgi:NDP-sugar pyrophosphorylase family protein